MQLFLAQKHVFSNLFFNFSARSAEKIPSQNLRQIRSKSGGRTYIQREGEVLLFNTNFDFERYGFYKNQFRSSRSSIAGQRLESAGVSPT